MPGADNANGRKIGKFLAWPLLLLIRFYRLALSPLLGANCRFDPSCSAYAEEALARHGAIRGSLLAAKRILRCHPWGGSGYDPVPAPKTRNEPGEAD